MPTIKAAGGADNKDWLTYGLDYAETRFSKLKQVTTENVQQLGLMWTFNLKSIRGLEATPIVVDGISMSPPGGASCMRWTAAPARSLDLRSASTGEAGYKGCCDVVNRGVALCKGKVFVGAYDGRLIAIDAVTGKKVWEMDTFDRAQALHHHRRAARRQGQGDHRQWRRRIRRARLRHRLRRRDRRAAWRFYTVPGNPAKPFEGAIAAAAAKTWDRRQWWAIGGGGTAWDSWPTTPNSNLLYIGVGNGSPWNQQAAQPGGRRQSLPRPRSSR